MRPPCSSRAAGDAQEHAALAVLRLGDAEDERERRGEVDGAGADHGALGVPSPPPMNVARMLTFAARFSTSGT
jgi:hypothetical protein